MCNAHTPLRENMHERTINLKIIVKHKLTSPKNRRIIKIIPPIDQLMKRTLSTNFYLKAQLAPYSLTCSHKKILFFVILLHDKRQSSSLNRLSKLNQRQAIQIGRSAVL